MYYITPTIHRHYGAYDSIRNFNLPELSLVISKGFFGNDSKLFNLGNAFLINNLSATMYFRYIYSQFPDYNIIPDKQISKNIVAKY